MKVTLSKNRALFQTLLGMALFFYLLPSSWGQTKYHFASVQSLAEQEVATKMIVSIFKKAGLDIDVTPMPAERAKQEVAEGRKDGDLLRVFAYGEQNTSVIRVPTPYSSVEVTAFALKSKNIVINTKCDLVKYRLVIIRGLDNTRDLTQGMSNVQEVTSLEQAMKLLESGRYDISLNSDIGGLSMLKRLKIPSIVPVGIVGSDPLYMYFNKNHKDMVPKLDAVIQQMTKSGELKRLKAKCQEEYLNAAF